MYTKEQVAKTLDHSALRPFFTDGDIVEACDVSTRYGLAALVVQPDNVALCARELEGSGVRPASTVGFPHGVNRPEIKALEARKAIDDGAVELDMVMNVGRMIRGDLDHVRRDIDGVIAEARKSNVVVKVILEICYLNEGQIVRACEIARDAGADFVKTSTGFGEGPATPEAVKLMRETVGDSVGVKAAGGIRSWDTAVRYLDLGCTRLGVTATEAILGEA
jgi:deoxyribose-phosphate aldolase